MKKDKAIQEAMAIVRAYLDGWYRLNGDNEILKLIIDLNEARNNDLLIEHMTLIIEKLTKLKKIIVEEEDE